MPTTPVKDWGPQQTRILGARLARGVHFTLLDLRYGNEPYYR